MRIRPPVATLLALAAWVLTALPAYAQCAGGPTFAALVPDGSPRTRTVAAGVGNGITYVAILRPGRSYSLSITTHDIWLNMSEATLVGAPSPGSCPPGLTLRNTSAIDPEVLLDTEGVLQQGIRVSFSVPSFTGDYAFVFTNTDTIAHSFTAVLTETTQFHPGWSTGGGFNTFYSIQNTTNASCSITLTLFNLAGTQVATTTQSVAAGGLLATNTQALGVGAGLAGTGILTHDCPPGGILVDAAIANFGTSPAAIIPAKFQPAR